MQSDVASLTESRKLLQQQLSDKVSYFHGCISSHVSQPRQKAKLDELKADLSNKEEQRKTLQGELGTELESQLSSAQQSEVYRFVGIFYVT